MRLGEAHTPGPVSEPDLTFDEIKWTMNSSSGFVLGSCNPSGISNKHEVFQAFPSGWWGVAETQASDRQLAAFRGAMRKPADPGLRFRVCSGAPAPLRAGSSTCGTWTGVLQLSSIPLRALTFPCPPEILASGRVMITMGAVSDHHIVHATVYLPPKGPTYPRAVELSDEILEPLTRELVLGRQGCRVISGDFNHAVDALYNTRIWREHGWEELQVIFQQRFGILPVQTCKAATRPDQIWLSPEMQRHLVDIGFTDWFPDHRVIAGRFAFSTPGFNTLHWDMPARLPWEQVDFEKLNHRCHEDLHLPALEDLNQALREWSGSFEKQVEGSLQEGTVFPRSSFGRSTIEAPRRRPEQLHVPRHPREGECGIASSFLGRSTQLWYQQYRRLRHYMLAIKKGKITPEAVLHRRQTWKTIVHARGFKGSFHQWWPTRRHQAQGSPLTISFEPPDAVTAELYYFDFQVNYKAYEAWHSSQRQRSLDAKWRQETNQIFSTVKPESKAHLDTLVDATTKKIEVVDPQKSIVKVQEDFPSDGVIGWRLQGFPAQVKVLENSYQVDSDLLLCDGQSLTCHTLVHDPGEAHSRLIALWSARWSKHAEVPLDHWQRIFGFIQAYVPCGKLTLPDLSYELWIQGAKRFKTSAARGPDGWSREDLLRMPRPAVEQLLEIFKTIETTSTWPSSLCHGLVHCLEKVANATEAGQFRPINLFSMLYRLWAGIRTQQLIHYLAGYSDEHQYGFLPGQQAADVWWTVQAEIECAVAEGAPLCGAVGDLVKAYNLLPRAPVWKCLLQLGIPPHFVQCWATFLGKLQRHFVVQGSCSQGVFAQTGFPEGCPLSCASMVAVDILWHKYHRAFTMLCRAVSYVDNLELFDSNPGRVLHALQVTREFCSLLDIELDEKRLFVWSTRAEDRQWLRAQGLQLAEQCRDLGGQMNYTGRKYVKVLTDRIGSATPLLKRLQRSKLSLWQKQRCVQGAILPRSLHACENVLLSDTHIHALRTKISQALGWQRGGSSAMIRLGLGYTATIDPGYYQLWRCIWQLRRHLQASSRIRDCWKNFVIFHASKRTHGPFGKIHSEFARIGWHLSPDLSLNIGSNLTLDFLVIPEEDLKFLARYAWQQWIAAQVRSRSGYHDLAGYDPSHLQILDRHREPKEVESLGLIRDGSFFTKDFLSKVDPCKSSACDFCGALDSRAHKYGECSKYAQVRMRYPALFARWHQLPDSLKLYGLPSANTHQDRRWNALLKLADEPVRWKAACPNLPVVHLFTDGSCFNGQWPAIALSGWAIVCPNLDQCVASGGLPGLFQTAPRAELFSLLQSLRWARQFTGVLHLWCDNQGAVEGFRSLQAGGASVEDWANSDLWRHIEVALQLCLAEVWIHKVAAHEDASETEDALADWTVYWNGAADQAAKAANAYRDTWFKNEVDPFIAEWNDMHGLLKDVVSFHLDVANLDFDTIADCEEVEPIEVIEGDLPVSAIQTEVHCWFTEGIEALPLNWIPNHALFAEFGVNAFPSLTRWMLDIEATANFTAHVSLVELYVSFCLDHSSLFQNLCGRHLANPYVQLTFAADFRLFRSCLTAIIDGFPTSPAKIYVDLAETGIVCCVPGFELGWQSERFVKVREKLRSFVGQRPIKNHQGFSRPWRL